MGYLILILGINFKHQGKLWIGSLNTDIGTVEVILNGDSEGPAQNEVDSLRIFLSNLNINLLTIRKQLFLAFLYVPIRMIVNDKNLVGVQFANRITGGRYKDILFLEE